MTSGRADGMIPGPTIMADAYDYDVFLSYNSANSAEVDAVAKRLRDEIGLRVFFDAWNVVAGDSVIEVLEHALERSRTIAVFLGADGMGPWHDAERQVALGYAVEGGRRVIPVLLPGARKENIPGFLRARSWVELAKEDGLARLAAGIAGRPNDSRPARTGPSGADGAAKPGPPHEPVERARVAANADEVLVAELARVFWDADQATTLVRGAGFPPALMPAFKTPIVFWAAVVEAAANGALAGGVKALADAAAKQYRANEIFTSYGSAPLDAKRPSLPASGDASEGAASMLGGDAMESAPAPDSDPLPGSRPGQAWNAVAALEPILRAGPASFVEALERALSGSLGAAQSRATRVATAIDALGPGPKAAKRWLEACSMAWLVVSKTPQPGEVLAASKALVRELASLWLPRRYGDGTQVERIDRLGSEGACPDLLVTANDAIITDVHVAAEEDRRLDVGPGSGGAGAPVARLALPEPVALAAEPTDPGAAAEEIIKGFSSQLGVLLVNTPETRQRRIKGHLQLLRDHGEPRYMVLTQRSGIVDATLVELKKIFPPLRIVSIAGSLDEDEDRILDILVHFFCDA